MVNSQSSHWVTDMNTLNAMTLVQYHPEIYILVEKVLILHNRADLGKKFMILIV